MLPSPISADSPKVVPGQEQLTQALSGPLTTEGPKTRGLQDVPSSGKINMNGPKVAVRVRGTA